MATLRNMEQRLEVLERSEIRQDALRVLLVDFVSAGALLGWRDDNGFCVERLPDELERDLERRARVAAAAYHDTHPTAHNCMLLFSMRTKVEAPDVPAPKPAPATPLAPAPSAQPRESRRHWLLN
jgi:hypothetical protein